MSINKAIIKGRIGNDLQRNNTMVKFSIATDESYKDKDGNKVEKTCWHNIVAFGKLADILEKYFSKGKEILIIGKIENTEKDGKYYSSIIADEFDFVGKNENKPIPS
ncbi:MAG: single-stranded DNA-binding protein [Aliarcobacter sp.]|nr:single-stranded DNA-binding protein [Aliarcobacter sp.]